MTVTVVTGVAGAGKTTVGTRLAQARGMAYAEADTFHPQANVAKMSAGIPRQVGWIPTPPWSWLITVQHIGRQPHANRWNFEPPSSMIAQNGPFEPQGMSV
jgi:carbohydrate kinase (thermoresistant glucokinase family)